MKNFILHISLLLVIPLISGTKQSYAQSDKPFLTGLPHEILTGIFLRGTIRNYANQPLYIYKCGVYPAIGGSDTLLLVDSTLTDKNSMFAFSILKLVVSEVEPSFNPINNSSANGGLYRINLPRNQWFYIINDGKPIELKTVYRPDMFNNWATDSMQIIKSDENKWFYKFQEKQKLINVANYVMKEMLRLYPRTDPFSKIIENEYLQRYRAMENLFKEADKQVPNSLTMKVLKAYYEPVNPDWKQPDDWRDSIRAAHFFAYFNPCDEFYWNTNILSEKADNYLNLFSFLFRIHRQTQSEFEENIKKASNDFLTHTTGNEKVHLFYLDYFLKQLSQEKMYDAFFSVYDTWVNNSAYDCEQSYPSLNKWREKASILRNIQIGSLAPDFEIMPQKLNLYQIPTNYTLLVFWATWCPHCTSEVPKVKEAIKEFLEEHKDKTLSAVFVSLDTDEKTWSEFVVSHNLGNYLHLCDFKGWKGEIVKKYNVYATPTMFLLDKDKKIIAKPETAEQLINFLEIANP